MRTHSTLSLLAAVTALALGMALVPTPARAHDDGYGAMLAYLATSSLDGHALQGATGALGINLAAGDANQQLNLRGLAAGTHATVDAGSTQARSRTTTTLPAHATSRIGGQALNRASGLISINQASGTANTELNSVAWVISPQGTRETSAEQWLAGVCACVQEATPATTGQPAGGSRRHAVLVEASALTGVQGVVQLNQVAGSGNVTANQLALDVGVPQR